MLDVGSSDFRWMLDVGCWKFGLPLDVGCSMLNVRCSAANQAEAPLPRRRTIPSRLRPPAPPLRDSEGYMRFIFKNTPFWGFSWTVDLWMLVVMNL